MKATGFQGIVLVLSAPPLPVHRVSNYSDADDAIMIERRNPMITDKVGVDGKMAIFLSADRSGKITIKVFQTSPSNKYLNQVCQLAQGGPGTFVPIAVSFVDTYRNDRMVGLFGYVVKPAPAARGKDVKEQSWEIIVEDLQVLFGDPLFVGFATAAAEGQ